MTKEELLNAAIQLEKDGYEFYTKAAANAGSPLSRETFENLAKDELKHIEWIKQYTTERFDPAGANKELYAKLRPVFADMAESDREAAGSVAGDAEALNFAIEREEAARKAYADWNTESDDPEVKDLCAKLAEVEAFHGELLENVVEYLEHPHDYFLREERWIVEG